MQGRRKGNRPFTPIRTEAEKQNFDRSVLGFLATMPPSGNRTPGQYIDYDAFSVSWNKDVALEEEQSRKGILVVGDRNLVNRKHPADLKHYMTESKKATTCKRTMEPHRQAAQDLVKLLKVTLLPGTAEGSSVGALRDGTRLVFPLPTDSGLARPRPQPLLVPRPLTGLVETTIPTVGGGGEDRGAASGGDVLGEENGRRGGGGAGTLDSPLLAFGREEGQAAGSSQGELTVGTPCFVKPVQACGTLSTILPRFDVHAELQQPWNPQLATPGGGATPPSKGRAYPSCQDCGHRYTTGFYASPTYHPRVGRKYTCLVKDDIRPRDHEKRKRGHWYKECVCPKCTTSSA